MIRAMQPRRRYYVKSTGRFSWVATLTFGPAYLFVIFASPESKVALESVLGVALAAVLLWGHLFGKMAGVLADDSGIVNRAVFHATRYKWSELAAFEDHYVGAKDCVYARLVDGSKHRLQLLPGHTVAWNGGETQDIVGLLNRQLSAQRTPAETAG
jgi:hypothetical protein